MPTESQYKRWKLDRVKLFRAVISHIIVWSELEQRLSACLQGVLRISAKQSMMGYAAYFSIAGFDARSRMVDNVINQFIHENPDCKCMLKDWKKLYSEIGKAMRIRNVLAHGAPFGTVTKDEKPQVRFGPPLFDVNKISRLAAKGSVPGVSITDIREAIKTAKQLNKCIGAVSRIINRFYQHGPRTLKQTLPRLKASLLSIPRHRKGDQN